MTTLIQYASGPLLNSLLLLQVFQYVYLLQVPCRHVSALLAALQPSSPTEKVLQSLPSLTALGEAGVERECSNQDMVTIQPSQLCNILNEIYSIKSWTKLTKENNFKIRWSCKC